MQWSSNGQRMDVRLHGGVTFTDDLTDVLKLDEGGQLTIRDWSSLIPHTIEIKSIGGTLTHAYFVGGLSRPWDDEARRQLATELPRLVRRSGLGAEQRTQSILQKKGVAGVLEEIDTLEGDYARRLYFQALVKRAPLDAASVLPVLSKVNDRMTSSDYDRREVLATIADRVKLDERAATAYVRAIGPMRSDYDRRQALSALFAMQPLPAGVANLALKSTADMHSDYDRREVMRAALAHGASVDKADALFPAIAQMTSSYDKREVLLELIKANAVSADAKNGLLTAAAGVSSDYDRRVVLDAFVKAYGVDRANAGPFFAAVKRMQSDYDRAEVLVALLKAKPLDGSLRQAYVDAAESLKSTYDQNRVLAALVKSER
jgi:hypothetical protein